MKRIAIYHLETLLWIARLGTFRAAAERLNTTQPAISARVRELEDQLGIAIFQREGRRMVLTARGRELVRDCEPLWAGFERALLKASDFAGASGVVRIGAGEIAAASCLPGFVQQIERDLPGVTLEIEIDLTARMLQQVLAGTTDIAFLAGPVENPGIRTCGIGSVGLVWLASPGTVAQGGFARPLPVWSVPAHSPLHAVTMATLAEQRVQASSINTCNNVRMLMEIVAGGGGAAVLPETMVRAEMAAGTLVEVLPRPRRTIRFEAAIRATEQDPVILELYRRAGALRIEG
ncbi:MULTISPECIES: LysR family transcriptional regulator [unclassified Novosphingobium]|uniref:LysR family transcriptional regulator n=1 Tax=unclassified Novosphingobium TaxID=2644732 RepID=UPI00061B953C|nr:MULTISPECIES: LysR family transcriptional regulator [unclassified Novosphingobium]GAO54068.1 transcriptional regulator [Novosphingobium sp. MD-1]